MNLSNLAATGTTSLTAALAGDAGRIADGRTATNPLTDTYFVALVND
ncbi:hypothetical protein N9E55_01755 [Flavobacteriaceae bacterium]|nr:hypothetical protein [Flavobacteriaceae bacterium]